MKAKQLVAGLLVLVLGMVLTSCAFKPAKKSGLVDTTCSNTDTNAPLFHSLFRNSQQVSAAKLNHKWLL